MPVLESHLDSPAEGAAVYDTCISISGWLYAPEQKLERCRVRARIGDELIGETNLLFIRPDVCAALELPATLATGFRILAQVRALSEKERSGELRLTASWLDESAEIEIARRTVRILASDLSQRPYGESLYPAQSKILRREDIYGSGPPVEQASAVTLQLIEQYLPAPGSLLDVGCGAGAYGPPLLAAGHEWLGLEVSAACWDLLARRDLPFRKGSETSAAFPVADGEFENAICIEVLEHVANPGAFLAEIARSIRGRALFSVPNLEIIPYLSAWHVVPWHLLEADHKNFFTRGSLRQLLARHFARVEVFSYYEHPLRTPDGALLHVHLFAVAEK